MGLDLSSLKKINNTATPPVQPEPTISAVPNVTPAKVETFEQPIVEKPVSSAPIAKFSLSSLRQGGPSAPVAPVAPIITPAVTPVVTAEVSPEKNAEEDTWKPAVTTEEIITVTHIVHEDPLETPMDILVDEPKEAVTGLYEVAQEIIAEQQENANLATQNEEASQEIQSEEKKEFFPNLDVLGDFDFMDDDLGARPEMLVAKEPAVKTAPIEVAVAETPIAPESTPSEEAVEEKIETKTDESFVTAKSELFEKLAQEEAEEEKIVNESIVTNEVSHESVVSDLMEESLETDARMEEAVSSPEKTNSIKNTFSQISELLKNFIGTVRGKFAKKPAVIANDETLVSREEFAQISSSDMAVETPEITESLSPVENVTETIEPEIAATPVEESIVIASEEEVVAEPVVTSELTTSEDSIQDTENTVSPEYVSEVKQELSEERKAGGLKKFSKTLIAASIGGILLISGMFGIGIYQRSNSIPLKSSVTDTNPPVNNTPVIPVAQPPIVSLSGGTQTGSVQTNTGATQTGELLSNTRITQTGVILPSTQTGSQNGTGTSLTGATSTSVILTPVQTGSTLTGSTNTEAYLQGVDYHSIPNTKRNIPRKK